MSTVEFDESSISELGGDKSAKVETADVTGKPATDAAKAAAPRGQIYTVMAREGINAAEVINTALRKREVGKKDPRRVEVISPHGPSTSGGKKARQSITLAPVSGQGPALMCGYLNVAQKLAELRDYEQLATQYTARFGARLDVSAEEYQTLTKELSKLLGALGFKVVEEEEDEEDEAGEEQSLAPETSLDKRKLAFLAAGVFAAIALFVLLLR